MGNQIGALPATVLGTLADIFLKTKRGAITPRQLALFAKGKNPFAEQIRVEVQVELGRWSALYESEFGIKLETGALKVPPAPKYPARLIVVARGMTMNGVYDACKKHFPCYRYAENLDASVKVNDRTSAVAYAVWVRTRIEADKENKNKSADQLKAEGSSCITLLERLLLELDYHIETGKHLDRVNVTLCAGSRDSGGYVPGVRWRDGGLGVGCYYAGDAHPGLRARSIS